MVATPPGELTAKQFVIRLYKFQSAAELEKIQRYFKSANDEDGALILPIAHRSR